jgi:hypothetical protein
MMRMETVGVEKEVRTRYKAKEGERRGNGRINRYPADKGLPVEG